MLIICKIFNKFLKKSLRSYLKRYLKYFFNDFSQFFSKEKTRVFPYFIGVASYFPQHILYLRPLPHARPLTILCIYMVQIVLCVFPLFYGHLVHYIISIIYIINITNFICYVDKMWTRIISYIN